MTAYKVVVDGSNIATEGRTLPSLNQLDEAVQAFVEEHPGADVLVIVDTSFSHRIDPSEAQVFEAAYEAGEIIMPPAGTIGRGDGFILKVADKLGATVFSNDSFQEFHGTYDWLFDRGRLIGGKPVPGLGWVFMDRTPVRGPKSREAVREAKRSQVRIGSKEAMRPMPVPKAPPAFVSKKVDVETAAAVEGRDGRRGRRDRRRGRGGREQELAAPVAVTKAPREARPPRESRESREPRASREPRPNDRGERVTRPIGEPVNESLAFISFVAEHGIGTQVEGEVESYSSHGFYISVGGARGYTPLHGLAEPMPRSAKEVVRKGETHTFLVSSFDAERRGIQLALVGSPAAAEIAVVESASGRGKAGAKKSTKKAAAVKKAPAAQKVVSQETVAPKTDPAAKKTVAQKVAPKKAAEKKPAAQKVVPQKAAEKKPVAKKTVEKKPVAQKPVAKKTVEKKPVANKTVEKVSTTKKAASPKSTVPAKVSAKAAAPRVASKPGSKKAVATASAVPAKKLPGKTPAKKAVAVKKSPAKKTNSRTILKKKS